MKNQKAAEMLWDAIETGILTIVKKMLKNTCIKSSISSFNNWALYISMRKEFHDIFNYLLNFDLTKGFTDNSPILITAVWHNNINIIKKLFENGAFYHSAKYLEHCSKHANCFERKESFIYLAKIKDLIKYANKLEKNVYEKDMINELKHLISDNKYLITKKMLLSLYKIYPSKKLGEIIKECYKPKTSFCI